jgi:hypothetical protein
MDDQSTHQVEAQTDSKHQSTATRFLLLPIFLVVYLLSIGPAAKLTDKGVLPMPVFMTLYSPIIRLCEVSSATNRLVTWYVDLFAPPALPMKP